MEKKTIYALMALIGLGALAVLVLVRPDKHERVGEKQRPLAEIKAEQVKTLEITQPGGKDPVTIAKQNDKWQVTAPFNKPADQAAVKSAVESLEKVRWGDVTTQQKAQHGEMDVADDKAVRVVAKDSAGAVLGDLYLGKAVGSGTMVRIGGKDDVYQATDISAFNFKKESKAWRDHVIFDFKADEAEKLSLTGGGATVNLTRLPPNKGPDGKEGGSSIYDAKWKVDEGSTLKVSGALDDNLINGIAQGVANLRAGDFVDDAKPELLGLAPGAAGLPGLIEIKVTFKGGKVAGLRVGSVKGDEWNVQALDSPQVFTVKKYSLERVVHLPMDVQDKTIFKLKADDLEAVTIQMGPPDNSLVALKKADKTWKADKLDNADEAKVKNVVDSLDSFSGGGFVAPGSAELASLAKPKATVTVKPKGGPAAVLKIGDVKGDEVIVQKAGQEAMWVKKYQADRLLKKPADLAKDPVKPAMDNKK